MPAIFRAKEVRKNRNAALKDLTPTRFACTYTMSCPAVFRDQSDGTYLIIGQACDARAVDLSQRVGREESLIRISGELLKGALAESWRESAIKYAGAMTLGASLTYLLLAFLRS